MAPSSSAFASVLAVAARMISAEVGPPSSMVAAWITHLDGSSPAVVATASPSSIGASSSLSSWIARPPARTIAPATPPPCRSSVFAALAIASTSSLRDVGLADLDLRHRGASLARRRVRALGRGAAPGARG